MAAATAPEAVAERAAEVAQGVAARAEVAVVADWAAVAAPVAVELVTEMELVCFHLLPCVSLSFHNTIGMYNSPIVKYN